MKWITAIQMFTWLIFVEIYAPKCSSLISRPCGINEFRCRGGTACLLTEKLCNGVRDCPEGEDETGSTQWDCTEVMLSRECRRGNGFRCRFGGCVPQFLICDDKPDCWGGTDESIEVCNGTLNISNRFQTTENLNKFRDPPQPTNVGLNVQPGSSTCAPIYPEDPSFKVRCWYNRRKIRCNSRVIPPGSIAQYTCNRFYLAPQIGSVSERFCQKDGTWSSIRKGFACFLDCGRGGEPTKSFIVGGKVSLDGKWPWHAALFVVREDEGPKYICGGSLISKNAVLTAAHCVVERYTTNPRNPTTVRVILGKYRLDYDDRDRFTQERTPSFFQIHEKFSAHNFANDIAIIWLKEPVQITEKVLPVCLPRSYEHPEPDPTIFGTVIGWGRDSNGNLAKELKEASLPIVSSRKCIQSHPSFADLLSRETTFCAGYTNGTSACDGDSGGGLVFRDFRDATKWKIVGITSTGIANRDGGCLSNQYSAFTKVSKFRRWIDRKLDHYRILVSQSNTR